MTQRSKLALGVGLGVLILAACGSDSESDSEGPGLAGASGQSAAVGGSAGTDRDATGGTSAGAAGEGTGGSVQGTGGVGSGGEWAAFGGTGIGGEALGSGGDGSGGEAPGSGGDGSGGEAPGSGGDGSGGEAPGSGGDGSGGEAPGSGGDGVGGDQAGGAAGEGTGGTAGVGTGGVIIGAGGSAGGGALCGGVECGPGQDCCGPPECGHCIPMTTGPVCADSCPTRPCGDGGVECLAAVLGFTGQLCVETELLTGELAHKCEYNPCGTSETLGCECAREACRDGTVPGPYCVEADPDTLTLSCAESAAVCASPDTPIATPAGERPIAALKIGDLVYSSHEGALLPVALVRVSRTAVTQHRVVRLETVDGVVLDISGRHPTADGRVFADLRPGDRLDGTPIVSHSLIPYEHPYTYDILPDSSTGTYIAGGKLIGSTLLEHRRSPRLQCVRGMRRHLRVLCR